MAQFTFLELHFEEGSIPVPDVLEAAVSEESEAEETDEDSGGANPIALLLGLGVLAVGIVAIRKLLDSDDVDEE